MVKPILPKADFNSVFNAFKIRIVSIGDNHPFDNSEKSVTDAKVYPKFLTVEIVDAPIKEQIDRTFRIKLGNVDNLKVGDILEIASNKYQLTNSKVTWYASQGQRYGHDWTYVNTSVKGGEFIENN